jgi:hypothetical protein
MIWNRRPDNDEVFTGSLLRCSFCNKSQSDVPKMVAGPQVCICSECIQICQDVFAEDRLLAAPDPEAVRRGEELVSGKNAMRCALAQRFALCITAYRFRLVVGFAGLALLPPARRSRGSRDPAA